MSEVSDERLRNTRAWAESRIGSLAAADVIVAACDEALAARQESQSARQHRNDCKYAANVLLGAMSVGPNNGRVAYRLLAMAELPVPMSPSVPDTKKGDEK